MPKEIPPVAKMGFGSLILLWAVNAAVSAAIGYSEGGSEGVAWASYAWWSATVYYFDMVLLSLGFVGIFSVGAYWTLSGLGEIVRSEADSR